MLFHRQLARNSVRLPSLEPRKNKDDAGVCGPYAYNKLHNKCIFQFILGEGDVYGNDRSCQCQNNDCDS